MYYILYTIHYILYPIHYILYPIHYMLYDIYYILNIYLGLQWILVYPTERVYLQVHLRESRPYLMVIGDSFLILPIPLKGLHKYSIKIRQLFRDVKMEICIFGLTQ